MTTDKKTEGATNTSPGLENWRDAPVPALDAPDVRWRIGHLISGGSKRRTPIVEGDAPEWGDFKQSI